MRKGQLLLIALASLSPAAYGSGPAARFIELFPGLRADADLQVSAQSAIIMDAKTGKVLWSKDPDTPRFPASTTKIMTALLLIEHCELTDTITAPPDVETVTEASLHLKPGEQVSAKDMLYALMLRSANDGAYSVACHVGGSVEGFAKMMNERAEQIGCTNTHFNNPHGLNDDLHTTTARDLALIAREAMRYPVFAEVVRTPKYTIQRSINTEDTRLISRNRTLSNDSTADGIKTGFTIPAGKCFVGSATRDGYRVITVVLKSEDWQADNTNMLNWAFTRHERKPLASPGSILASITVEAGAVDSVPVTVAEAVDTIVPDDSDVEIRTDLQSSPVEAPVEKGQKLGTVRFIDSTGFTQEVPIVAAAGVHRQSLIAAVTTSSSARLLLVGGIFGGAYLLRRKSRRRTNHGRLSRTYR